MTTKSFKGSRMQHSGVPTGSVIVSKSLHNRQKKAMAFLYSSIKKKKNPDPSKQKHLEDD